MPSSKDPVVNRRKAQEYRLAHPEWHRRTNREWAAKKRSRQTHDERNEPYRKGKRRDPIGYLLKHAMYRAARLGIPFGLTREDLVMPAVCPVLGLPFEWGTGQVGWRNMRSPSLDRIKPQLGYVRGNVEIISNRANHLKSNGTISEIEAVLAYMKMRGCNEDLDAQLVDPLVPEGAPPAQLSLGW